MAVKKAAAPAEDKPAAPKATKGESTVYMRQQITGTRNGEPWPAAGEPCKLPAAEAADLVASGYATAEAPEQRG